MGHHHHRQLHVAVQSSQKRAKTVRAFRVQPGGGLIQQQQRRVHDEGACQRHALDHAAGQITGHFVGGIRLETDHLKLDHGSLADHFHRQGLQLTERESNVFKYRESRKQGPLLKQHPHPAGSATLAQLGGRFTQYGDLAFGRMFKPQHLAQQHGFTGAGATDQRQHLTTFHRQVKILMDNRFFVPVLKNGPQFLDLNDGFSHVE